MYVILTYQMNGEAFHKQFKEQIIPKFSANSVTSRGQQSIYVCKRKQDTIKRLFRHEIIADPPITKKRISDLFTAMNYMEPLKQKH